MDIINSSLFDFKRFDLWHQINRTGAWTNPGLISTGPVGISFGENWSKIFIDFTFQINDDSFPLRTCTRRVNAFRKWQNVHVEVWPAIVGAASGLPTQRSNCYMYIIYRCVLKISHHTQGGLLMFVKNAIRSPFKSWGCRFQHCCRRRGARCCLCPENITWPRLISHDPG